MTRTIGNQLLPSVGLGCMGMSEFYGETNDQESLATLLKAYEIGYRHFDSADMYGRGHNEKLLGKFLHHLGSERENVFITSKVGIVRNRDNKYSLSVNSSRAYIKKACDESLIRLGTEYIDLYYLHRRHPETPLDETMQALSELVAEGKIRSIGLCEVSSETLNESNTMHPIAAVQSEYSLWTREVESDLLPSCQALGIAFVGFSPLGRGFLTGSIQEKDIENADPDLDLRTKLPRFSGENMVANLELVKKLKRLSNTLEISAAQLALAWILNKGDNIHIIPGTKKTKYLNENFLAKDIILSEDVVTELNRIFTKESVSGARYPQQILAHSNG